MLLLLFVGVGLAVRLLGEGSLQFREYEVSWNQSFFAGSVVRDRQKFQFAVSSPLGVLTIWASVNASGLFPPCTIKSMRCLDPRDKSVKEIFPFFHTGGFQLDRVGDQFTLTATASQLVNPSVNATIYLYWTAQRLSTLSRRSFTDSDIKFDFDVSLPARPDCEWQLSTGWPGATVEVVGPKEPFLPSSGGSGPADEPDEIFNVSQSGGRLKWGCAQFAQAFDASGNSSWARVETSSGTQTVWMRFFNSSSSGVVRRIFMDPTLSVVLTVTDPSTTVAVPPPGSTLPASSDPNVGLIVGLTVGLTAAAVILTVVALVLAKRSRAKRAKEMAVKIAERENEINKERTQSMMLLPVKPVY